MDLRVNMTGDTAISFPNDVSGEPVDRFLDQLQGNLNSGPDEVIIDCSKLTRVASGHVSILWEALQKGREAGVTLRLREPSDDLLRVLRLLDLDTFFPREVEPGSGTYDDRFAASSTEIDRALERFRRYLKVQAIPEPLEFELRTAFYEVVTNIRLHAAATGAIEVSFSAVREGTKMTLTFEDSGIPFDPTTTAPNQDIASRARLGQRHGFGLVMIRKLADYITYSRRDGAVNVLTLERRWEEPQWNHAK